MKLLEAKNVSVSYSGKSVLKNISFDLLENQWLMIAGPNGAGKSTLARAITKGVPYSGEICVCNTDIQKMKSAQLARMVGMLSQKHSPGYNFTAKEVIRLGRYAHSRTGVLNAEDERAIQHAISMTDLCELSNRSVLSLSGGELQRVFLAQLFAQSPQIMILDEPANNLDLSFQHTAFELIKNWIAQEKGRAVVTIVHDLSLALKYGTHALLINDGELVSNGTICDALAPQLLNRVFGLDVSEYMIDMLSVWK